MFLKKRQDFRKKAKQDPRRAGSFRRIREELEVFGTSAKSAKFSENPRQAQSFLKNLRKAQVLRKAHFF
jgi:hypothetical protein